MTDKWQGIHTHVTFSLRVCFSFTVEERSSSSRRDVCFASIARFDARVAARMSFRRLSDWDHENIDAWGMKRGRTLLMLLGTRSRPASAPAFRAPSAGPPLQRPGSTQIGLGLHPSP